VLLDNQTSDNYDKTWQKRYDSAIFQEIVENITYFTLWE